MDTTQNAPTDIYARVSRASDDRLRSVHGQVDDCTARLADLGHGAGMVHVDNSRSAWNASVRRPGWDALMARLESGEAGGVIVFDLARFSRRPVEGERLIEAAERGLVVLDSEDSYDLLSANGRKAFRDQMAGAAYESDRLSTRIRRGKKAKALRGEPNHSWRPFGYEADGVTIRESEAEVVREMARRVLARESQDAIVADLNDRGSRTSAGKPWTRVLMRQVLERPRNAGHNVYRGEVVGRLPGEPVLDAEEWGRLCALFASRRRGRPATSYVASGIALCGLCGHRMYGRPRTGRRPYPDGEVAREYWCQAGDKGGCQRIAIDQRALDGHLAAFVVAVLGDSRHAATVERAARATREEADRLDAAIAEAEHVAGELAGRLGRGEIGLDRYDAATGPLDARLAKLRAERDALPAEDAVPVDPAVSRGEWEARWRAATVEERRDLLRAALRGRRVVVGPGRAVAGRVRIEG